jgi:flavoprotein
MTTRTKTPVFILPVEREGNEVNTTLPDGSKLELFTRDLDAQNTAKLQTIKGISVLDAPEDIKKLILSKLPGGKPHEGSHCGVKSSASWFYGFKR